MENIFPKFWVLVMAIAITKPAASIVCNKATSNVENTLKQHLFCNGYDPSIRPAKSEFDMINITMIPIITDFDFHPYQNTMDLHIMYRMTWQDTSLQWNSSDWFNITLLRPNYDEIWLPEFEHINSNLEGDPIYSCTNPHCCLLESGHLICRPKCSTTAKCFPDYSRWPYNTLTCQLWFANRDKELVDEINFVMQEKYTSIHGNTASWCMTRFSSNKTLLDIPGATGRSVLLWEFGLQHAPHTELITLYFPMFVLVMLNIFNCWLHSPAGEKTKIILISLICHFQLLQDLVIKSSAIPGIVMFILASMVLTLLLFVTTLILRWLHNLHTTPPRIIIRSISMLTNNRMMYWFLQTEYLSLGHKPTVLSNYMELRDWTLIVKLVDRCVFVLYIFIYLWLFVMYVPLQHDKYNLKYDRGLCSA
ncbi:acetylcholine receptor subunit delta-like [Anopheles funestus]|uniref:acetylcholine receptor subunit delta-like n=1 Tax=Anopheles funestus TaxID=62324 RepID=UPI0020C5C916|nr:acetylcholine receptor subunit delta-like [Anopheles funestus]